MGQYTDPERQVQNNNLQRLEGWLAHVQACTDSCMETITKVMQSTPVVTIWKYRAIHIASAMSIGYKGRWQPEAGFARSKWPGIPFLSPI